MRIDKSVLNTFNKQDVINLIRTAGPINKAEIARVTGLSIPTVMKICDEFAEKGLIRDIGKGKSSGGKPPQMMEFIPDSYYLIGVDIGTTNIVTVLTDLSAAILCRRQVPTGIEGPPDSVIGRIADSVEAVMEESGADAAKILGVGVGMPGLLDTAEGRVLFSPDFRWEGVDVVEPLKVRLRLPIVMDNVTRAMAMGENWFGLGRAADNFLCVNLGYGIGSAMIIGGELYSGSSGSSGELGHITLEKDGPLCDCGNRGCLEALASANAIAKKARSIADLSPAILRLAGGDRDRVEARTVFDAAKAGDAQALGIVREAVEYIGIAIAGMINMLDPSLIILEGGVSRAGALLTDDLQDVITRRRMKHAGRNVRIVVSELGENAAAIGAASFLLKRMIEAGGDARMV